MVLPPPGVITVTMTATIAATTATAPAIAAMMNFRRFAGRACLLGGSDPTAGKGAVEGSDA